MTPSHPLAGIRVLDFGHTVMGPSCAMILADLGAEVLKIEPAPGGDPTRQLKGFGTGYFGYFNRNKKSLAVDLKSAEGLEIARQLSADADVLVENFAPGTMARLGLAYEDLAQRNPRLIYATLKGFLPGPYESRTALDEVVQMMAGLAYMTGPTGRPLRAGTSVIDIAGGMFAVIAIQAALRQRDRSGQGQCVEAALFESAVFLMGQHLCYAAQSAEPIPPMPERISAWAVYEIFRVVDGRMIFIGITSDKHWRSFCASVDRREWLDDPDFASNNARIDARARLIPLMQEVFAHLSLEQALATCERAAIPFAPINRPEDLFADKHLAATGGLLPTVLPGGTRTRLPRLPIRLSNSDLGLRRNPPEIGADSEQTLAGLGYTPAQIAALMARNIVAGPATAKAAVLSRSVSKTVHGGR